MFACNVQIINWNGRCNPWQIQAIESPFCSFITSIYCPSQLMAVLLQTQHTRDSMLTPDPIPEIDFNHYSCYESLDLSDLDEYLHGDDPSSDISTNFEQLLTSLENSLNVQSCVFRVDFVMT